MAVSRARLSKLGPAILSERLQQRMADLGMSQSELGRRIGTRQSTINAMLREGAHRSRHLLAIARELRTTTDYLTGATDDLLTGATDDLSEATAKPTRVARAIGLHRRAELVHLVKMHESAALSLARRKTIGRRLARRLPTR